MTALTESLPGNPYPWQANIWNRLCSQLAQERLGHAYLLCGERGLGKQVFVQAAARLLLCDKPTAESACGSCQQCLMGQNGSHPDLLRIAPEDGSKVLKIDQIRALISTVDKTSHSAGRKVVIMEQADALNISAANALLKILEEPPGNTVLLLLSDSPGSLLPTIRSRCQRILFTTPDSATALAWLGEVINDRDDLPVLLDLAGGKPPLVQQLLESGELEQRLNIIRAFVQISEGKLEPLDFAATSRSLDVGSVMEYLWQTTALIIKYLLCKDDRFLVSSEIRTIVNTLQQRGGSEDDCLARLLQLNRSAEDARRQLNGMSNPNRQLVLESMMWRWARINARG
ncbi:MAG: DNA polymerase III subunit delta' [Gammaproteobacteria bacterium]|nr:DNA polymerase III subunit delta' [Gammaproteobacteria bacterium]